MKIRCINKKVLSLLVALGITFVPVSDAFGGKENVSFFAEVNEESNQYGANQRVFKSKFEDLIKDPYIWDEMQKYYPVKDFASRDEAVAFYRSYFSIIEKCGCGYAAAGDVIFKAFEGREKEFEKAFGYPMYTTNSDGSIDFNYEIFMLEFFNFYTLKMKNWYDEITIATKKDMYRYELDTYANSEEFLREKPKDLTEKEYDEWKAFDDARIAKYVSLFNQWNKAPRSRENFGVPVDGAFGYIYVFLAEHHINCSVTAVDNANKFEVGDIIGGRGYHLYDNEEEMNDEDPRKLYLSEIGSHYVYVTDITEDGKIIVSSWGKKYLFDPTGAKWKSKVLINVR